MVEHLVKHLIIMDKHPGSNPPSPHLQQEIFTSSEAGLQVSLTLSMSPSPQNLPVSKNKDQKNIVFYFFLVLNCFILENDHFE